MFTWISFIYNFFSKKGDIISKVKSLLLPKGEEQMLVDNEALKLSNKEKDKIIAMQNKVSNVTRKAKPTNLDGITKRMRNKKL